MEPTSGFIGGEAGGKWMPIPDGVLDRVQVRSPHIKSPTEKLSSHEGDAGSLSSPCEFINNAGGHFREVLPQGDELAPAIWLNVSCI